MEISTRDIAREYSRLALFLLSEATRIEASGIDEDGANRLMREYEELKAIANALWDAKQTLKVG